MLISHYPQPLIELVTLIVEVDDGDGNELFVAVVVAPMHRAFGDGDDVAPADPVNLLVLVPPSPLPSPPSSATFLLLSASTAAARGSIRVVRLGTSWVGYPQQSPTWDTVSTSN